MARAFQLLGNLQFTPDGDATALATSNKGLALVAYLIVTGQEWPREFIADLLWDSESTKGSLNSLRSLLTRVRKDLPELHITRRTLAFRPTRKTVVDLILLRKGLVSSALSELEEALALYNGNLLGHFYLPDAPRFNEWLVVAQEQLHREVVDGYQRLCTALLEQEQWTRGAIVAQRWLVLDPLDEEALRWLMRMLTNDGRPVAALRHYEAAKQLLWRELSIEPDVETAILAEQIRAIEPEQSGRIRKSHTPEIRSKRFLWGQTPLVGSLLGRTAELGQLVTWLVGEQQQVVAITGIGGVGKTTLAAETIRSVGGQFDAVIWQSMLNAPTLEELLPDILRELSENQYSELDARLDHQLSVLLNLLRQRCCLLVLDNLETVLHTEQSDDLYASSGPYGRLLEFIAQKEHQSCLLITSRELPQSFRRLDDAETRVRVLQLPGLDEMAGRRLLGKHGLVADDQAARMLVDRYSGNPLALNLVGRTIQEFYGGDVAAFAAQDTLIFDDIRRVLDQQFRHLSDFEREILIWLTLTREPQSLQDLQASLAYPASRRILIEALRSLLRRSLLHKNESGFLLQNVITEYLTDTVNEQAVREIRAGQLDLLRKHALLQAQALSYVRRSQARLFLRPIAEQLLDNPGEHTLKQHFALLLESLRGEVWTQVAYAPGNLLNLMLHMNLDIRGADFSHLPIRQAYLSEALLPQVNFAGTDLSSTVFVDVFGIVYSVAFSPEGNLLAASGGDGRVRVWDIFLNQPLLVLDGHSDTVHSVVFSPDGSLLASGSADKAVRLWRLPTADLGNEAPQSKILQGHEEGVHALAFSPDGRILASAGADNKICLWDAYSGLNLAVLGGHRDRVQSIAFSSDGVLLASGSRDQTIGIWNLNNLLHRFQVKVDRPSTYPADQFLHGHNNWVNVVSFSPSGRTLASAGADGMIGLWDVAALPTPGPPAHSHVYADQPRRVFEGHGTGVQSIAFSPDGKMLVSGGNDHSVRLWEFDSGQLLHVLSGHTNWVNSVRFSPDGHTVASGSWDHSVRLWRVRDRQELRMYNGYTNWIFSVAFSPDGRELATGGSDKRVRLLRNPVLPEDDSNLAVAGKGYSPVPGSSPGTDTIRLTLEGHSDWVWKVALSPDCRSVASAGMDFTARVWDLNSGQILQLLHGHNDGVQAITYSPDSRMLATGGLDHTICLWDLDSGRLLTTLQGHTGWCLSLHFSPDGRFLASSGADRTVRLWNLSQVESPGGEASGQILYEHDDGVQQVRFSPDGRLLASGSWDKTVRLWDIDRAETRFRLQGHSDIVRPVAFSHDGCTLLSAGNDMTVRLWNIHDGSLLGVLEGHTGWVFSADFSPDDRLIASGSGDETIKIWDVQSGFCLKTLPMPKPYEGVEITGATGITGAQRSALKMLGAVENS